MSPNRDHYIVRWEIEVFDEDADSPEQAAQIALEILNETSVGDPDGANCFEVTDRARDQIHHIDLGADPDENTRTSHWPRPADARLEPVLNETDAACLIDDQGYATVRVRIDQIEYLNGYSVFLSGSGDDDHFDALHRLAFSFGMPYGPSDAIVAVDGSDFLVDYTTDLSGFLADG